MISFSTYLGYLRDDFRNYVISESEAFRKVGTKSRSSRTRLIKIAFLRGFYSIMESYDEGGVNMYGTTDMNLFVDQINTILGTSYSILWEASDDEIWRDSDNAGVWDDDGVWEDVVTT